LNYYPSWCPGVWQCSQHEESIDQVDRRSTSYILRRHGEYLTAASCKIYGRHLRWSLSIRIITRQTSPFCAAAAPDQWLIQNQSINQWLTQPTNRPTNQSLNHVVALYRIRKLHSYCIACEYGFRTQDVISMSVWMLVCRRHGITEKKTDYISSHYTRNSNKLGLRPRRPGWAGPEQSALLSNRTVPRGGTHFTPRADPVLKSTTGGRCASR